MADFDPAVSFVLKHEGGLEIDPADPGGITRYGISARSYPGIDVKTLSVDQAKSIYLRDFWKCAGINSQAVANKVLDMCVNFGSAGGVRLLQQAMGSFLAGPIVCDGIIGPRTIDMVNAVHETDLLLELKARSAKRHCDDVLADPGKSKFLLGWLRRDIDG
jgi:lysozyme family protein